MILMNVKTTYTKFKYEAKLQATFTIISTY